MRITKWLLVTLILTSVAFGATSVASLNGTYNFQIQQVNSEYGYYNSSDTWINLGNGGQCPKNTQCQQIYLSDVSVGTIYFNGKGSVKFTAFMDSIKGPGDGPPLNKYFPYKVSVYAAAFTVTGITNNGKLCVAATTCPVVTLALGSFNPAGVATVNLVLITKTGDSNNAAMGGTAVLQ